MTAEILRATGEHILIVVVAAGAHPEPERSEGEGSATQVKGGSFAASAAQDLE